jgi:DNA-binding GntR family transcriptional regulator
MFDRLRQSVEGRDPFALIESDMAFHWAVCEPSGHELLLEQLRGLQVRTRQFIVFTKLYHSDAEGEVEAHTPILMAVRSQDPQRAEMAMRDHITTAGERLLVRMSESTQRQAASSDFVGLA